jgi:hypothetical protein
VLRMSISSQVLRPWLATIITLVSQLSDPIALACPAMIAASSLPNTLTTQTPSSMRLFRYDNTSKTTPWQALPTQIDPINEDGVLDIKRTASGSNQAFAPKDRIVFETKKFGPQYDRSTELPCNATSVTEVIATDRSVGKNYGYLVSCKDLSKIPASMAPLVSHDPKDFRISTEHYSYEYQPTNQLLFRTLTATPPGRPKAVAGHNSDFNLRLNFKRFFTMTFGNQDVESYVEASHLGDVGAVALVNFYIKVLMFKMDLKMATMASFYQDSALIPMIIDVPLPAENHLNPGSGILYSFRPMDAKFDLSPAGSTVPKASTEGIKLGSAALAKAGESDCRDVSCFYKLKGSVDSQPFMINIVVPRSAAKRGFYPQLVTDVAAFKTTMGWEKPSPGDESLIGFYYENSGLEKGRFQMSYWIGFNNDAGSSTCPSPIEFKETLSADDIADHAAKQSKTGH